MKIQITESKTTWFNKAFSTIGDLFGATIALILVGIIYIPAKIFGKSNENEEDKRKIIPLKDIELEWKLFTTKENIKVYEAYVWEWPKELEYIDFHQGDEFLKVYKTEPEIKELNNMFFGDFYPYDLENNYVEYHNGIYFIAYPTKESPDDFTLYHLSYSEQKLTKIKDDVLPVKEVNIPNNESIEIVTKSYDKIEKILITK